jgi:hypothetical protein
MQEKAGRPAKRAALVSKMLTSVAPSLRSISGGTPGR